MRNFLRATCIVLLLSFLVGGCRYKPNQGFNWDVDIAAPVAFSEAGIADFVASSLVTNPGDNGLSLVYRDTLLDEPVLDFLTIPDTVIRQSVSLKTLELPADTVRRLVTIGELARQLITQGGTNAIIGTNILNNQGNTIILPPVTGAKSDVFDIDASNFFEYATISSGDLHLMIFNKTALQMENAAFRIKNRDNPTIIAEDTFAYIPPNGFVENWYPLAGKTIQSNLTGQMTNLDMQIQSVKVDTNEYIEILMIAEKLKASDAVAVFPNQTVIDSTAEITYDFGDNRQDVEITKLGIKYGKVKIKAYSTVEDTILFQFEITNATNPDGSHPGLISKIPPAPVGGVSFREDFYEIHNAYMDLSLGGTTWNKAQQRIKVDLLSSGQPVHFDLSDSIYADFGLVDIVPYYMEGYVGKDTLHFVGEEIVEAFDKFNFNLDGVKFKDPRLGLTFANSVGVDAELEVAQLEFFNTKKGTSLALNSPWNNGQPLYILGPTTADTSEIKVTTFETLNAQNSNIADVFNMLPNKIRYNMRAKTNYNHGPGYRGNFGLGRSKFAAMMDLEIPLEGQVQNFSMRDTTSLDFKSSLSEDIVDVKSGTIKVHFRNDFPLKITTSATIYDAAWNVVAVLTPNDGFVIEAGVVGNGGVVLAPTQSLYAKTFSQNDMQDILKRGKKIIFNYRADTQPNSKDVKLYSNYRIRSKMVANFEYHVRS
ncbi:MAG: hypothetical protein ACKVTZ_03660 [Bacteroidia bacterium]